MVTASREVSRLQALWDQTITDRTKAKEYSKTAVLLLSWESSDLDTQSEVDELADVFSTLYKFDVEQVLLNEDKPHLQLNFRLADFVHRWDNTSTLLICYYAGHGWTPRQGSGDFLLLKSVSTTAANGGRAEIAWNRTEPLLRQTDSDVLLIFDCCSAGGFCQSRSPSRYEFLAACTAEQTTAIPGPHSFTSALIWALRQLQPQPNFSTSELQEKITHAPNLPKYQIPVLAHRNTPNFAHIVLSPHKPRNLQNRDRYVSSNALSFLDLRFYFDSPVNDSTIRQMAKSLNSLVGDRPFAQKISFLQLCEKSKAKRLVQQWRQFVIRRRSLKEQFGRLWLQRSKHHSKNMPCTDPCSSLAAVHCSSPEEDIGLLEKIEQKYKPPQEVEEHGTTSQFSTQLLTPEASNCSYGQSSDCGDESSDDELDDNDNLENGDQLMQDAGSEFGHDLLLNEESHDNIPKMKGLATRILIAQLRSTSATKISSLTDGSKSAPAAASIMSSNQNAKDSAKNTKDAAVSTKPLARFKQNEQDSSDDEINERRKRQKTDLSKEDNAGARRKFACPFFKHNPADCSHRACGGPGWLVVRRVKEHVYRDHARNQCQRCGSQFESKDLLRKHRNARQGCQLQEYNVANGYDSEQEDQLRKRKRTNDHSQAAEEMQWIEMYKNLFKPADGSPIPSPYYESETQEFINFMSNESGYVERVVEHCLMECHRFLNGPEVRAILAERVRSEFAVILGDASLTYEASRTSAGQTSSHIREQSHPREPSGTSAATYGNAFQLSNEISNHDTFDQLPNGQQHNDHGLDRNIAPNGGQQQGASGFASLDEHGEGLTQAQAQSQLSIQQLQLPSTAALIAHNSSAQPTSTSSGRFLSGYDSMLGQPMTTWVQQGALATSRGPSSYQAMGGHDEFEDFTVGTGNDFLAFDADNDPPWIVSSPKWDANAMLNLNTLETNQNGRNEPAL